MLDAIIMKSHRNIDIALLLIRVGLGAVFVIHGWEKVTNMEGTIGFFASLGLSSIWAYVVAYIELIGGLAVLLGSFTGWAAMLLAAVMVGAIGMVKLEQGFLGGYEFDLVLFLSAVAVALAGPGKYTVKRLIKGR